MIDRTHKLSVTRQSKLLSISRSSVYYRPKPVSPQTQALMNRIDRLHLELPFAGSPMLPTMDMHFCLTAVEEAIAGYGKPEMINSDQGSQFTSQVFTDLLKENDIRISMDGTGAWRDNVFVERLWRSVKYEEVYLHAYETVSMARAGLKRYFRFYNSRPHSGLVQKTPDQVYFKMPPLPMAA